MASTSAERAGALLAVIDQHVELLHEAGDEEALAHLKDGLAQRLTLDGAVLVRAMNLPDGALPQDALKAIAAGIAAAAHFEHKHQQTKEEP